MNLLPIDAKELDFEIIGLAKHYGLLNQLLKLCEELGELVVAIVKHVLQPDTDSKAHIAEEMADVEIMLQQVKYLLSISNDDITRTKLEKVSRQKARIEEDL